MEEPIHTPFMLLLMVLCGIPQLQTQNDGIWYGVDCSIFVQQATSGVRYSGSVESGLWTYYTIRVSAVSDPIGLYV